MGKVLHPSHTHCRLQLFCPELVEFLIHSDDPDEVGDVECCHSFDNITSLLEVSM